MPRHSRSRVVQAGVTGDLTADAFIYRFAKLTGESLTTAVNEAVRERLVRVRSERGVDVAERLLAIGRRQTTERGPGLSVASFQCLMLSAMTRIAVVAAWFKLA